MLRKIALALMLTVCAVAAQAAGNGKQSARVALPKPEKHGRADQSGAAVDVVRGFYNQLLFTMQRGEKLGFQGRYDTLKPAIERAFNLPLMTRFAAGTGWTGADTAQQQKLVSAFSDFSIATYAGRFKNFSDEKFEVLGEKPALGGAALVETRLIAGDDPPVVLNYLLRRDDRNQWRINDVYLDATISELATRRAEFSAVIKSDGVDALIDNISGKAKTMQSL